MTNLVDSIKLVFTPDLIGDISNKLGENTMNIEKSIESGVSAVLVTLLSRIGQGGIESILHDAQYKYNIDDKLPEAFPAYIDDIVATDPGNGPAGRFGVLLYDVFGSRLNHVVDGLSAWSSVKSSSYHQLLAGIVPLSISVIHRHTSIENELDVSNYLLVQQENILKSTPLDLDLKGILRDDATVIFAEPDRKISRGQDEEIINIIDPKNAGVFPEKKKSDGWLVILLLVIAMGIVWWLWKGCTEKKDLPDVATLLFIGYDLDQRTDDMNLSKSITIPIFQS